MKISSMKVDAAAIEEGGWIGGLPELDRDVRVLVRGVGSKAYTSHQAKLLSALPRHSRERLEPAEAARIATECLVETALLDWSGLEGPDGAAIPYSRETARQLLTDPDLSPLRDAVLWAASVVGRRTADAN